MALPRFSFAALRPAFVPEWCAIVLLAPALGPFHDFGMDGKGVFLPAMKQLLAKQNLTFSASALTGVICFPSFHTLLALTCPWAVRRCGPLFFWSFAGLNLLMLFTIPFFGGHYLIDMIAGAGVFAAALAIVKWLGRKSASAANVSPGFVATSAGAC